MPGEEVSLQATMHSIMSCSVMLDQTGENNFNRLIIITKQLGAIKIYN